MEFDDLVRIKASVVALKQLQPPLPIAVQAQLDDIVESLPESSYELPDVAIAYPPFDREYQSAIRQVIQESGTEGERLKFAESTRLADDKFDSLDLEDLIEQLYAQLERLQIDDQDQDNTTQLEQLLPPNQQWIGRSSTALATLEQHFRSAVAAGKPAPLSALLQDENLLEDLADLAIYDQREAEEAMGLDEMNEWLVKNGLI